ncbi:TetR/AcrR family transcriptional regulator [Paenibacillus sp. UNC499MF]|uniref:TetR/AcrR family transcriptional regulator n=1 Tax=Paenibacillus sp. UNC499MF TaxID=1502751 RepID=UPI0008A04B65|nr:TetR/AcrR family transcriptional regulator [Paenibacillus sp. UNC499MF]SEG74975.1 transcriptional regulator, TetR family [Paenibacillus sp. UNC499MF]
MPLQLYERNAIFEACLSVFARHGYKDTSTGMLAEAAGISKALIFHHFKSKKLLYFSLVDHCFEKAREELRLEAVPDYGDFFEAIDAHSRKKLDYFRKHPKDIQLIYEVYYQPPEELKEEIDKKYGHVLASKHEVWERLFESVPLREGVDRKQAFELVIITLEHFENKFVTEVTDLSAIDDHYIENMFKKMNEFCTMIRHGIAQNHA